MAASSLISTAGPVRAARLQHTVFYVRDMDESREFYESVFDLQFSAKNHPDSSAAMRLSANTMNFFSFGHYHHDICLVTNPNVQLDHDEFLYFSMQLNPDTLPLAELRARLQRRRVTVREGSVLKSRTLMPGQAAIHFPDPNGHWLEVLG